MRHLRAFALFWWDFVVGDDYRLALGVVILLGVSALLTHTGVPAWWVLPLGVVVMLALSVSEVARRSRRAPDQDH